MFLFLFILSFVKKINTTDLANVNFYQLTGLQKTDDETSIVRSFKRFLAQKRKNMATASERTHKMWHQTQLAYDILGNPDSRLLYDLFGNDFINVTGFQVSGYQSDAALEAIKQMFGQVPAEMQNYGGLIFYPLEFDIIDFLTGSEKTVKMFRQTRCTCPNGRKKCADCRRNPWRNEVIQHTVTLPPGASEFHRIIAKGFGDPEKGRGATDVIFVCYCRPDPQFIRDGADVLTNATITFANAIKGGEIEIENFDGEKVEVDIQGGVQHGETRRIPGLGLPYMLDNSKRGDLVVTFSIEFPESLTEEQKKIIQEELPDDPSFYE